MRRLAATLLALAACNTGFDPQYRVKDLRILGIRARVAGTDVADPFLTDSIQLDSLVANPLGRSPLTVTWLACAPPLDARVPPCLDPEFLRDPVGLLADPRFAGRVVLVATGETPAPISLASVSPELAAALSAALDVAFAQVARDPTWACRLFVEGALVAVAEAGGRREVALKSVRFTSPAALSSGAYVRNVNPAIASLQSAPTDADQCTGGGEIGSAPVPGATTVICGRAAGGSTQPFNQCEAAGTLVPVYESISWQWYVTDGTFPGSGGTGNATGEHLDFERPAAPFTLWGMARDGRGGVAWTRRDVAAP